VQYFGRPILETDDRTVLYEHYERSDWVLATAGHLEKLTQDGRFRKVYYMEKAEHRRRHNRAGALFHKSAPKVKDGL